MCLTINTIKQSPGIPCVAFNDIRVYKYGKVYKRKVWFGLFYKHIFVSRFYEFAYIKNEKPLKEQLKIDINSEKEFIINKGYHAFLSPPPIVSAFNIGVFIIPKGTKYYLGMNNDIVAETMIYKQSYI